MIPNSEMSNIIRIISRLSTALICEADDPEDAMYKIIGYLEEDN